MNKEERIKILINNVKLNINEQNVYEFGLCVEQWKQILDYIEELQQENQKYKEVIDKAINWVEDWTHGANDWFEEDSKPSELLDILKKGE